MKATCLQDNLLAALKAALPAVFPRATLPVLTHFLISAEGSMLKVSASDLEIAITSRTGAQVEQEGAVAVPAKTLYDLVDSFPKEEAVSLELVERTQTLNLKCARYEANVKGVAADEFPLIPVFNPDEGFKLPADRLRELIRRAVISAAAEDTRPILTGVLVVLDDGTLSLSAADGFRLSVCKAEVSTDEPANAIVPARALQLLKGDMDYVQVAISERQALFQADDVCLVAQLIEGPFPDVGKIIPQAHATRVVVDTDSFRAACAMAFVFARESANLIGLAFDANGISISAISAELGDYQADLQAEVDGPEVALGMNVKYLLDGLKVMGSEKVVVDLNTHSTPIVIRPEGDDGFVYVVMPMFVRSD